MLQGTLIHIDYMVVQYRKKKNYNLAKGDKE